MNQGLQRFEAFVRERGLRMTESRSIIAKAVFTTETHFKAKHLVDKVRGIDRTIGTATVYRTLAMLVESGLVAERDFEKACSHYEHTIGARHHDHLLCNGCGDVVEFEDHEIEELQRLVAQRHEFVMTGHDLRIFGLCAACRGKGGRMGPRSWKSVRSGGAPGPAKAHK